MSRCTTLLVALIVVVTAAFPVAAFGVAAAPPADALRLTGPANELAVLSRDAWMTARQYSRQGDRADDAVILRLLALAGAARLSADELSDRGTSAATARLLVTSLDGLAESAQDATDLARSGLEVRAALRNAREGLARLTAVLDGKTTTSTAPPTPTPTPAPTPAPPSTSLLEPPKPDPDAPTAAFDAVTWKRTLTPDLVVEGRVEGRVLARAELQLKDDSGTVVYRNSDALVEAIKLRAQGQPKNALSTVTFRHVIPNGEVPAGASTLVLVVEDSKGRHGEASTQVEKRSLF